MDLDKILKFFSGLTFEEESHSYFYNNNKMKTSVSGVIKHFVEPFDSNLMSGLVAKKENKSKDEVLESWSDISKQACEHGTQVHLFGEHYPFDRTLKPQDPKEEAVKKFWDSLPPFITPLKMELRMFHKELLFAGTADILCYDERYGTYSILDYKTNKDLFKNYKGKKLLEPFDKLLDNPFNKYQLQLSLYQILLEQVADVKVGMRRIIWLLPDGTYRLYDTDDYTEKLKELLPNLEL